MKRIGIDTEHKGIKVIFICDTLEELADSVKFILDREYKIVRIWRINPSKKNETIEIIYPS
jgi:hypothetical protein